MIVSEHRVKNCKYCHAVRVVRTKSRYVEVEEFIFDDRVEFRAKLEKPHPCYEQKAIAGQSTDWDVITSNAEHWRAQN